jgi:hypothetical protein
MSNQAAEAILVLGMHRSGTSAVAGAVRLLGATQPTHTIPAGPDNPSGFWEALSILATNDWILKQAGATWYECLGFDANALDARTRTAALTFVMLSLTAEFAGASMPLIKDPRICLLMDFWLPALRARGASPVALLVVRSPDEVAESLATRERLPAAVSAALWLRYMLDAEFATRDCRRDVLAYDDLLRDWRAVLTLAGQRAALVWPVDPRAAAPRIDRFLDVRLRHFGSVNRPKAIGSMPFAVWLDEAYAALRGLAQDPTDQAQLRRLDHVRTAFQAWSRAYGQAWAGAFLNLHEIRATRPFEVSPEWLRIATDMPNAIALPA